MSFAQQRLWLLDQIDSSSPAYNIPYAISMTGRLDVDALTRGLNALVQRHEALRTTFRMIDEQPMQMIADPQALPMLRIDLRAIAPAERQQRAATRDSACSAAPL